MKNIGHIFIALSIAILAGVIFMYRPVLLQYTKILAWKECVNAYKFEHTDGNTKIVTNRPIEEEVDRCMGELLK